MDAATHVTTGCEMPIQRTNIQLDEPGFGKRVHETVAQVVQQMCGQIVKSSSLGDLFVLATGVDPIFETTG